MPNDDFGLRDLAPHPLPVPTAAQIVHGVPIPPVSRLAMMSADDWEVFTEEWLTYLKNQGAYCRVRRSSGSGDLGLDVVAFTSTRGFAAPWDSYQCKHYAVPLAPNDVCIEVAKIIYYSFHRTIPFNQSCPVPRRHVFVSPKGAGLTVQRWFSDAEEFRHEFKQRWPKCAPKPIDHPIPLQGQLLAYVDAFDFAIFDDRSAIELLEEHAQTPFHAARFGGGLPPRDKAPTPPPTPAKKESVYLRKLLNAYEDHLRQRLPTSAHLDGVPAIRKHYNRQRELFYSAEALRNFARDRTPEGTFSSFQNDIYHGVVDTYENSYDSAFERLKSTVATAARIDVGGNALVGVARVPDKQGACHQLANDCVFTWATKSEE